LGVRLKVQDICNIEERDIEPYDYVVNFAAESHVDRSLQNPLAFVDSNVKGLVNLLNVCGKVGVGKFIQISTDEVFGSVETPSTEDAVLNPSSPYSASKASAEMFCKAYVKTWNMPIVVVRSVNNFGPFQHEEKFIPTVIKNALRGTSIPLYGNGKNRRTWIYVMDTCEIIYKLFRYGKCGETYNIGSEFNMENIELAHRIITKINKRYDLISYVEDRLGHDFNYVVNDDKLLELGVKQQTDFDSALDSTIKWYKEKWGINR